MDPRGRWVALAIVGLSVLFAMTTSFSTASIVPQLRVDWGLSPGAASGLTIAVQIGFVVGAPRSLLQMGTRRPGLATLADVFGCCRCGDHDRTAYPFTR